MNCGYENTSGITVVPVARINGTSYPFNSRPIAGLSLQFITPANDTNASKITVGPVGEQFIGMTNFSCFFLILPPMESVTVILTVLGQYIRMNGVVTSYWCVILLLHLQVHLDLP